MKFANKLLICCMLIITGTSDAEAQVSTMAAADRCGDHACARITDANGDLIGHGCMATGDGIDRSCLASMWECDGEICKIAMIRDSDGMILATARQCEDGSTIRALKRGVRRSAAMPEPYRASVSET